MSKRAREQNELQSKMSIENKVQLSKRAKEQERGSKGAKSKGAKIIGMLITHFEAMLWSPNHPLVAWLRNLFYVSNFFSFSGLAVEIEILDIPSRKVSQTLVATKLNNTVEEKARKSSLKSISDETKRVLTLKDWKVIRTA